MYCLQMHLSLCNIGVSVCGDLAAKEIGGPGPVTFFNGITPTGSVTFKDGASILGTASLNGSGQASFATSSLTVGTHNITAAYGGDTIFLPSASPSFIQVVMATGNATNTTLMVNGGSNDPIYFGFAKGVRQKAGFVVNVTGGTDGDSVVLMEGNRQIGPVLNLNSGQTIFSPYSAPDSTA